jgi:hypothetical protein
LVLASIGTFGVVVSNGAQRTHENGIRMAKNEDSAGKTFFVALPDSGECHVSTLFFEAIG